MSSTVEWPALLERAIAHARDGFEVSACQRRMTQGAAAALFEVGAPEAVRRTLRPPSTHDRPIPRFAQPDLATTLTEIAENGAETFYRGALAKRIAAGAAAVGSPLTVQDLAEHRADWVEPLRLRYRDGEAVSFPPPTQGFAALAILGLLEGFDLAALDEADLIHLTVEATKLAFEDRDRWLTDPAASEVPVGRCLDADRLAERRRLISRRRARPVESASAGGDTVAIVAADAEDNAVCVIQSLYHEFGAGGVAGETGGLAPKPGAGLPADPPHPQPAPP